MIKSKHISLSEIETFFDSIKHIVDNNIIFWILDSNGVYKYISLDIYQKKTHTKIDEYEVSSGDEFRFGERLLSFKIPCKIDKEKCIFGISIRNNKIGGNRFFEFNNDCIKRKLAGINHDISNTINNTVQVLEIMKLTESVVDKIKYLDSISYSLRSLKSIIEILIKEEFLSQGGFEEISLSEISELLYGMYNLSANVKNLQFDVNIDSKIGDDYTIKIFKSKFYRILINIINNSIKYTRKGHIIVNISVLMNNLVVDFEDSGPGFPEDVLKKIRHKKTLHGEVIKQNSGFGWYIIIQYVRQIKAKIAVQNIDGGSRVTMVIPLD